jgi:hypothetical protein
MDFHLSLLRLLNGKRSVIFVKKGIASSGIKKLPLLELNINMTVFTLIQYFN